MQYGPLLFSAKNLDLPKLHFTFCGLDIVVDEVEEFLQRDGGLILGGFLQHDVDEEDGDLPHLRQVLQGLVVIQLGVNRKS